MRVPAKIGHSFFTILLCNAIEQHARRPRGFCSVRIDQSLPALAKRLECDQLALLLTRILVPPAATASDDQPRRGAMFIDRNVIDISSPSGAQCSGDCPARLAKYESPDRTSRPAGAWAFGGLFTIDIAPLRGWAWGADHRTGQIVPWFRTRPAVPKINFSFFVIAGTVFPSNG